QRLRVGIQLVSQAFAKSMQGSRILSPVVLYVQHRSQAPDRIRRACEDLLFHPSDVDFDEMAIRQVEIVVLPDRYQVAALVTLVGAYLQPAEIVRGMVIQFRNGEGPG